MNSVNIEKLNYPLVTVVIPTYDRPYYLERAIDSVLNQTYPNIEIYVVDDNNPNTSARECTNKVMNKYASYSKVHYIQHEMNKNGSAARNTGLKVAHGEFITFLDDDDVICNEKIQRQVECLQKLDDSWGACYTGYRLIKYNGRNQTSCENKSGYCYIDALMRTLFMGSGSNLLLRKRVVDEINGYDESFVRNQDIEFLVRVLEKYKLAYVDEVLLTIYQDSDRISDKNFETLDLYTMHYLECFMPRIYKLEKEDRVRVLSVISLERCRIAFYKKKYIVGLKILKENNVPLLYIFRYVRYLLRRFITKQSYGFNGL